MVVNPNTLSPDILDCPKDCPFLASRSFLPQTLPFYCNKYDTFLGANMRQNPRRHFACCGILQNIVEDGLSFIDSYTVDHYRIEETKNAFLKLNHGFQKMFVDLVSKSGVQIVLDASDHENPDVFADKILKARQEVKDKYGSPEAQEFKGMLDAEGMPLLSRQTKTLLMNLFMVMDKSEKEMVKNILQNKNQVEAFLESFQKQPQDNDLLKNVRALVYEYDRKNQMEIGRQRALNLSHTRLHTRNQERLQRENELQRILREKARETQQKLRVHTR
ncbi:MAG: hypothetical protein IKS41_01990 [Alphaproteobacteria bacterium]|nr:hypothetical protein [Alphaproteobacteria bacterium]